MVLIILVCVCQVRTAPKCYNKKEFGTDVTQIISGTNYGANYVCRYTVQGEIIVKSP